MASEFKCPKCGGELQDNHQLMPDFIGEEDDDRFSCIGFYTGEYPEISQYCSLNRTPSCGDFGLEHLGNR